MSDQMEGVVIDWIGGKCPVQAEGTVDGKLMYFRARGERWRLSIGGNLVSSPEWGIGGYFGDGPFDAGWMDENTALGFIREGIASYRAGQESDFDIPLTRAAATPKI